MTTTQREIFAAYGGIGAGDLGRIMGDSSLNPSTQAELLATALAMPFKETARAHYRSLVEERGAYARQLIEGIGWLRRLGVEQSPQTGLDILPRYSFVIDFEFTLAQPYLSKDDDAFYIIDNPVRKDKVFKTPMVAPSSWKGSLRHVLWQLKTRHDGKEYHDRVRRMFGETRGDDTGQSGRLFFYPSFFDRMSLEIINPHDRVRRVGKNPILFEAVPEGTRGRFTLLYTPFDRIGNKAANPEQGLKSLPEEVADDLTVLVKGVQAMFTTYGFGAKTSSGFGLAAEALVGQGTLSLHMEDTTQPQKEAVTPEDPWQELQADIDAFIERYSLDAFSRWTNQELSKSGWGKKRQSVYKRLRNRHPDWDGATGQWRVAAPAEATEEEPVPPPLTERPFASFSELVELSKIFKASLTAGGDV